MFETTKTETLFATPFARIKVADHDILDAELLAEGARMRAASEGVQKSNRGGWHSQGNIFDNPAECIQHLRAAAQAAIFDLTRQVTKRVDPADLQMKLSGWMNANPQGGFNAPHTHPGAHWSGVYYVSQPDVADGTSGMIEFLDPRTDLPNWRILRANTFRPKRKIRPAAGEIILFPSYLVHWVYPNETDDERVTVAFNATFRKKRSARKKAS
ncbi:TIGR02466 family protein [Yoonia sp. F2084L]|uniref:TIGR02466 family protein n=1 Tax=Yoonia sp. F2084L TaxID=2926419 RepID=UPI001FF4E56B|nr:TIGR02466 family protein [Yoonia sp. F2084L]MCK0094049.1 TIGR02466 family protein [Yoonia sp. F2084L]